MKKRAIVAVIVLLLIGLDQLVKSYIVQQIPLGEVRSWIPNFVSLTYLQNRGAAFSSYKISSCYSLSLLWLS
ncbi:Lipoprotein signal peptidase [Streptococcus pneumoniae]|nr:Lipoprotein signal peptidase [Streptococcus pneumoniae]